MSVNEQYQGADPFGGPGGYGSTGAPGSPGVSASETSGPVVGSPAVVPVYQSSQVAYPHMDVTAGDTTSASSDSVVPAGGDPMTGLSETQVTTTGAGLGSHTTAGHHPNSMSGGR